MDGPLVEEALEVLVDGASLPRGRRPAKPRDVRSAR